MIRHFQKPSSATRAQIMNVNSRFNFLNGISTNQHISYPCCGIDRWDFDNRKNVKLQCNNKTDYAVTGSWLRCVNCTSVENRLKEETDEYFKRQIKSQETVNKILEIMLCFSFSFVVTMMVITTTGLYDRIVQWY